MSFTAAVDEELAWINSSSFKLGEYIYIGMGKLKGRTVCIAVAYKIDYCFKKAMQFTADAPNIIFTDINKVKVRELAPRMRFTI